MRIAPSNRIIVSEIGTDPLCSIRLMIAASQVQLGRVHAPHIQLVWEDHAILEPPDTVVPRLQSLLYSAF